MDPVDIIGAVEVGLAREALRFDLHPNECRVFAPLDQVHRMSVVRVFGTKVGLN